MIFLSSLKNTRFFHKGISVAFIMLFIINLKKNRNLIVSTLYTVPLVQWLPEQLIISVQVTFCHHLVFVVGHKLFIVKFSPVKPLNQIKPTYLLCLTM